MDRPCVQNVCADVLWQLRIWRRSERTRNSIFRNNLWTRPANLHPSTGFLTSCLNTSYLPPLLASKEQTLAFSHSQPSRMNDQVISTDLEEGQGHFRISLTESGEDGLPVNTLRRKSLKHQPSFQSSADRVLIRKRRVGGQGIKRGRKVVNSFPVSEAENGIWNE